MTEARVQAESAVNELAESPLLGRRLGEWLLPATVLALALVYIYARGFVNVSADEWVKGLQSWETKRDISAAFQHYAWMPGHFLATAAVMFIIPHVVYAPRFLTILSGLICVWAVQGITARFLGRRWGMYTALTAAVFGLLVWMSATGLTDAMYIALVLCGFRFWLDWTDGPEERRGGLLGSCALFGLANGFHYHPWLVSAFIGIATIVVAARRSSLRTRRHLPAIVAALAMLGVLPILWMAHEWHVYGSPVAFWTRHTEYAAVAQDVGRLSKAQTAPLKWGALEWLRHLPYSIFLAPVGAVALFRGPKRRTAAWLLALCGGMSALEMAMIGLGGMPTAYAPRIFLLPALLALPICAAGIERLWRARSTVLRWSAIAALVIIPAYNVYRLGLFPKGHPPTIRPVGRALAEFLDAHPGKAVVEMRYWQSMGVLAYANRPDRALCDRPDRQKRDPKISLLMQPVETLRTAVARDDIRYTLAWSETARRHLEEDIGLSPVMEIKGWTLYDLTGVER